MQDSQTFESQYNVIIVGARCAGASAALLLARAGLKVLLVDRHKYGSDMLSTHALMRAGVLQLKRWGVLPALMAESTPKITETIFHYGSEAVRVEIKPDHDVAFLCGPRRHVLDRLLVDAARNAGAVVRHGVSVTELQFGPNSRVTGVTLRDADGCGISIESDLVIGADGRQSMVARSVNAEIYLEGSGASGYVYGYYSNLADDVLHWYFEKDTGAGVIPTNDGEHCVFVAVPREQFANIFRGNLDGGFIRMARANSPELADEIVTAHQASRLRGFAGSPGFFRQSYGPGWALVGDAGYFKDPLTAHGITDAFVNAELLTRAVLSGTLRAFQLYQEERDSLSMALFDVTDDIASFGWDLDDVKEHHRLLSNAMRAESAHVAGFSVPAKTVTTGQNGNQGVEIMATADSPWKRTIAGQPAAGATAERTRTTSMRDVELFTEMTGDRNPIHYDEELATASPFGGLIVQGGVTTGLFNAVVAEDLPGPGTVFLETNWRFLKAVKVGETITATITVENVRDDKPICKLDTVICNSEGDECVVGTATTYTMPLVGN